jgi:hypothetical protein
MHLLAEPAFWLVLTLIAIAVIWPRKHYYCRCHNVKLGTQRERRIHGESPRVLKG